MNDSPDTFNFQEQLDKSHEYSDEEWWRECYQNFFPDFHSMHDLRDNGWWQNAGVDRKINLSNGEQIYIDEKTDEHTTGNFVLEYWSKRKKRAKGWVNKPLKCDYIAYAFVNEQMCYLLPHQQLKKLWNQWGDEWKKRARSDKPEYNQYRITECETPTRSESWVTEGVTVPVEKVLAGLQWINKYQYGGTNE